MDGRPLAEQLADWASRLELDAVPERVMLCARAQVLSQLAAARAALGHPLGRQIVRAFGDPLQPDPARAAYALAALTVCLDYDETAYAGHVSHSAVGVPVAYSRPLGLGGRGLLTAVVAANECAARVTAAATIGPFRGQTAAHTHLVGSVAGRLRGEGAPAETWTRALGLALALPPWTLDRGFYGSDAKALVAAVPVRMGLDACDAAAGGLAGPPDILEHPEGFLARFADVPVPEAAVWGLGTRWHTETLSFKAHPGSAYIGAPVDCALELHERLDGTAAEVEEIVLHASMFTAALEARAAKYVAGGGSATATLTFSPSYCVATALLTGGLGPADFAAPAMEDPRRWALAKRVRVEHDMALTRRALLATAPLGEALREGGEEAARWLGEAGGEEAAELARSLGDPADGFEDATKAIGARVSVRLPDGTEVSAEREAAAGTIGFATPEERAALVRRKWLATGGSAELADAAERLEELGPRELAELFRRALLDG